MKHMKPILPPYSACSYHPAPESQIHESCRYHLVRTQIKQFSHFRLHSVLQSHINRFLYSAGRKKYVPFIPIALLVYDPDDKSCMFNQESSDLETTCLNAKDDNRKSKYQIFESGNQNFHINYRSVDCESPGLKSEYVSFNSEYVSFNVEFSSLKSKYSSLKNEYQSFNSEYQSLKNEYQSVNSEYPSLKSNYPGFNSEYVSFNSELSSLKSEYSSLISEYQSLKSKYLRFNSNIQSLSYESQSFKNELPGLKTGRFKIAGEDPVSKKSNNSLKNIQVWNPSSPDVSNIYREEEDPDRFRMPTGGQHAGLRESIQHWKRCTGSPSINKLSK